MVGHWLVDMFCSIDCISTIIIPPDSQCMIEMFVWLLVESHLLQRLLVVKEYRLVAKTENICSFRLDLWFHATKLALYTSSCSISQFSFLGLPLACFALFNPVTFINDANVWYTLYQFRTWVERVTPVRTDGKLMWKVETRSLTDNTRQEKTFDAVFCCNG